MKEQPQGEQPAQSGTAKAPPAIDIKKEIAEALGSFNIDSIRKALDAADKLEEPYLPGPHGDVKVRIVSRDQFRVGWKLFCSTLLSVVHGNAEPETEAEGNTEAKPPQGKHWMDRLAEAALDAPEFLDWICEASLGLSPDKWPEGYRSDKWLLLALAAIQVNFVQGGPLRLFLDGVLSAEAAASVENKVVSAEAEGSAST